MQFCGFGVQNSTRNLINDVKSHTYQWGKLSPIPFHIDRNNPNARCVFGGPMDSGRHSISLG